MPVNKPRRRGSYAPLSAHYYKDDAIIRAGEKAEVLYLRGLAFCADTLSDGAITEAQLKHVGVGLSAIKARARTLVDVGLWTIDANGCYWVVAWLGWNKSRDAILDDARKDSNRKGSTGPELPFPPEPPPDSQPEEDPYVPPDSKRNPNGHRADSNGSPDGFHTLARRPARAPSRARAELGQDKDSSAPTELARVPRAVPASKPAQTLIQRAQAITQAYYDAHGPMTNWVAVQALTKTALKAGWDDPKVAEALLRLHDQRRTPSKGALERELQGTPKSSSRPTTDDRVAGALAYLRDEPEQGTA